MLIQNIWFVRMFCVWVCVCSIKGAENSRSGLKDKLSQMASEMASLAGRIYNEVNDMERFALQMLPIQLKHFFFL